MHDFKAPIRDIQFTLYEVLGAEKHYQRIGANEANRERFAPPKRGQTELNQRD